MRVSELIKLIKKSGCYIIRHGSEHDIWYSPMTQRKFQVPRHPGKEIKTGTLNKIMKDAGLK